MKHYQKILVALDGSAKSLKAFDRAIQVAKTEDAELLLVNIIELRAYQEIAVYDNVYVEDHEKGVQALLADFAQEARDAGVKVSTLIERGSTKSLLAIKLPKRENVDLIIMGATGMSYLEKITVGSTAQYVSMNAICDVIIVKG